MKIFFDTEFQELTAETPESQYVRACQPLSFGFVNEIGEELYVPMRGVPLSIMSDWVRDNVGKHLHYNARFPKLGKELDRLPLNEAIELNKGTFVVTVGCDDVQSRCSIRDFCGDAPEFWADWASYDWTVLCQLYGTMMDLPKGWPMYVRDFQQMLDGTRWGMYDPNGPQWKQETLNRHHNTRINIRKILAEEGPKQDPATLHHALHDARHLKAQFDFIRSR